MTTEGKVKELILRQYKTLKNFAVISGIPYGTIDGILRRGFANSNYENVFRLCRTLGISADELSKGNIVSISKTERTTELNDILNHLQANPEAMYGFTIDGILLTQDEIDLIVNICELTVGLIKKRRQV